MRGESQQGACLFSFPQRFIGSDAEAEALGGPQLGVRQLCREEQASYCLLKSYPAGAFCD